MRLEGEADQIEKLQTQLDRWTFAPYRKEGAFAPHLEGPASHAEIESAETSLGRKLPEDLRWLCLTHGHGHTSGQALSIDVAGYTVEFDRIGAGKQALVFFPDPDLPPNTIPCASTITGERFLLRLDGANFGSVWYWNDEVQLDLSTSRSTNEIRDGTVWHWDMGGELDPRACLIKVADSFTDLLASSQHIIAHTERLTMRSFEHDDSAALLEIHGSPTTMQLMPRGLLQNEDAAVALIDERRAQQQEMHYSIWAVVLRSSGAVIGSCGFRPSATSGPFELGYVIDHNHWGQGYATEAATAAINHIFEQHVVPGSIASVFATIRPNNAPSIAVAQRLGMREVESTADEHGELLKFELESTRQPWVLSESNQQPRTRRG